MTSSLRPSRTPARPWAVVAAIAVACLAACGDADDQPEAQPAPDVSTFQTGDFGDIPLHPRSDPVGTRTDDGGVTTQSYVTDGATTRQVLDFYVDALPALGWTQAGQVEEIGPGGHQGDWESDDGSLRISATDASALDTGGDVATEVTTQYSLVLTEP